MSAQDPSQEPDAPPTLEEELVAYLDGELDAAQSRRIESLLAQDSQARRKLRALQTSWDMLDELERPAIDARFTRTTLEMVAVAATKEVEESQQMAPVRRRRRWFLATSGVVVAAAAGFLAVLVCWPNPNKRLLRDLPVVENIDVYRQIGDFQFLRMLRDDHLFDEDHALPPGDQP